MNSRIGIGFAVIGLAALGLAAPQAHAATCQVQDVTAGGPVSTDLQGVIDAAAASDKIEVSGTCVGHFVIDKSVSLTGPGEYPDPVAAELNGAGTGTVVTIDGTGQPVSVDLNRLRITGGSAVRPPAGAGWSHGGGISITHANVWLSEGSIVNNRADYGGGVYVRTGVLYLGGERISRNEAALGGGGVWSQGTGELFWGRCDVAESRIVNNLGGGITCPVLDLHVGSAVSANQPAEPPMNYNGPIAYYAVSAYTLRMHDRSSIRDNRLPTIVSTHRMSMRDGSQVADNTSEHHTIVAYRVNMHNRARVVGNTIATRGRGGGIYATVLSMHQFARIAGNHARLGGGVFIDAAASATESRAPTVRLRDNAVITHNTAGKTGGGVYVSIECAVPFLLVTRGNSTVIDNTPNNIVKTKQPCP